MSDKSSWIEEAKKSRAIMFARWQREGKPMGDFYMWLLEQVETNLQNMAKKQSWIMDKKFKDTIL